MWDAEHGPGSPRAADFSARIRYLRTICHRLGRPITVRALPYNPWARLSGAVAGFVHRLWTESNRSVLAGFFLGAYAAELGLISTPEDAIEFSERLSAKDRL
jgi:hypothetical protein